MPASSSPLSSEQRVEHFRHIFATIEEEVGQVIVGQRSILRKILTAFFAGGHVLIESVPGLGKTLMAKSLSQALALSAKRIQFTPDLMPSDIVGTQVLSEGADGRRYFEFKPGPVFANIVLADEINRATPKTQSAVLEAMEEEQVTVFGETHTLTPPFLVAATQNPVEIEGTYPLPEAQLDRFLLKLVIESPSANEVAEILERTTKETQYRINPVLSAETAPAVIAEMQNLVREVLLAPPLSCISPALSRQPRLATRILRCLKSHVISATAPARVGLRRSPWGPRSTPCSTGGYISVLRTSPMLRCRPCGIAAS